MLDRSTADSIAPGAATLTIAFIAFLPLHVIAQSGQLQTLLVSVTGFSAVVFAAFWWRLAKVPRPLRIRPPVIVGCFAALTTANAVLHLAVTFDVRQTTNLMLAVIGVGALVHDRRWAVGIGLGTLAAWGTIAVLADFDDDWMHYSVGLLIATVAGGMLHVTRTRTVLRLARAQASLLELALRDEMTGLANRRGLLLVSEPLHQLAQRTGLPLSVLYLDVDGLKHVNDTAGHAAGDDLIRTTGQVLVDVFREADVVARVGGDEFAVVLYGPEQADTTMLRRRLTHRLGEAGITASVGEARMGPVEGVVGLEELLDQADAAMYAVKRTRRAV